MHFMEPCLMSTKTLTKGHLNIETTKILQKTKSGSQKIYAILLLGTNGVVYETKAHHEAYMDVEGQVKLKT